MEKVKQRLVKSGSCVGEVLLWTLGAPMPFLALLLLLA